jgi:hypothetical protein
MKRDKHHITTHARRLAAGTTQGNSNGNLSRLGTCLNGYVDAHYPFTPHAAAPTVQRRSGTPSAVARAPRALPLRSVRAVRPVARVVWSIALHGRNDT